MHNFKRQLGGHCCPSNPLRLIVHEHFVLLLIPAMKTIYKALIAVIRTRNGAHEILVFKHPHAGVQIPKGTVEDGETVEMAAVRELKEESGIELSDEPPAIGTWQRIVGGGPNEDRPLEINEWSVHVSWADKKLPERWKHQAEGGEEERGLIFDYFWLPIDVSLADKLEPVFSSVVEIIVNHVTGSKQSEKFS